MGVFSEPDGATAWPKRCCLNSRELGDRDIDDTVQHQVDSSGGYASTTSAADSERRRGAASPWLELNRGLVRSGVVFPMVRRVGKRLFDVIASAVLLIVLSPLMLVIAALVWANAGSPVIFKQVRPGLHGRPFTMYKFRTMTDARDENGRLLPDEQRLTKFGRFLRSTSLDELPELFNVLKGDMSLVGPRPLLMEYLPLYTPEQARRHEVRPGITGWAQVNGRNAISWEEKFKYDVWYVDNWSLWLDLKILFMTIVAVLRRNGISAEGHATMPVFRGQETQREARPE